MKTIQTKLVVISLSILSSFTILTSCVNTDDISITEPNRYTNDDITSYSDLFDVFWTTMDQRYNYFHEQERKDGMNWSHIYKEYSPKFKALKTFGRSTDNDREIVDDYVKAKQYFTEIINPIIDRHFNVRITFPMGDKVSNTNIFRGGSYELNKTYPFDLKHKYMEYKLGKNYVTSNNMLAGYLQTNPDIFYFTFNQFNLSRNYKITLDDKYLNLDEGSAYVLLPQEIENSKELNAIKDLKERKRLKDLALSIFNEWTEFPKSAEVVNYHKEISKFNSTEIISDELVLATQKVLGKSKSLTNFSSYFIYNSYSAMDNESSNFISWFINEMNQYVFFGYRFRKFEDDAKQILSLGSLYQQFFNPLHRGEIKKIIIDLRGNPGGSVVDARFFSDRFITKSEVFSYQRTKEGNGRFNYTPWVEARTNPHKFGIPANIPIVLLTDNHSASMSEITTLMLKSQGNHVVSIGDYTIGATAGLGPSDDFNGGTRDVIGGRLNFYMPLMAMKNAKGEVIEGIGIKPDIYVTPPTDDEIEQMRYHPINFKDRVLNEAAKYLSSK